MYQKVCCTLPAVPTCQSALRPSHLQPHLRVAPIALERREDLLFLEVLRRVSLAVLLCLDDLVGVFLRLEQQQGQLFVGRFAQVLQREVHFISTRSVGSGAHLFDLCPEALLGGGEAQEHVVLAMKLFDDPLVQLGLLGAVVDPRPPLQRQHEDLVEVFLVADPHPVVVLLLLCELLHQRGGEGAPLGTDGLLGALIQQRDAVRHTGAAARRDDRVDAGGLSGTLGVTVVAFQGLQRMVREGVDRVGERM